MRVWRRIGITVGLAGIVAVGGGGCFSRPDTAVRGYRGTPPEAPPATGDEGSGSYRIPVRSNTPEGKKLCDQLMLNSEGLLSDAQLRDNRDLYVVLGPDVEMEEVPALVRALVVIMHRRFPEENVAVHVHARDGTAVVDATVDLEKGIVTYEIAR